MAALCSVYAFGNRFRKASGTLLACVLLGTLITAHADRRDPAPLPEDLVRKLTERARVTPQVRSVKGLDQSLEQLDRLADEDEKAEDAADDKADGSTAAQGKTREARAARAVDRRQARKMLYEGSRVQLSSLRRDVLEDVRQLGAIAAGDGAPKGSLVTQINERFDRLEKAVSAVQGSRDAGERRRTLRALRAELHKLRSPDQTMDAGPISTFAQQKPVKARLLPKADTPPRHALYGDDTSGHRYAFLGNASLVASAPSTPPEALASCGYTEADLAATPDAPQSSDITTLAAKLGYSPLKIFQYVYNEIRIEPYYGALKGASATLQSKSGGATDQASLLIALLRASKIPARYVAGVADISDAGATDGGRLGRWLGVKSYAAAATVLDYGGMLLFELSNRMLFNHVWVEACVPYAHYRGGSWMDNAGERWIPLDPSFKQQEFKKVTVTPTVDRAAFLTDYLSTRKNGPDSLVEEAYAQKMQAAARQQDPNATLEDIGYKGAVVPLEVDILPSTLPYDVWQYNSWRGVTNATSEVAALPNAHRYKLYIDGLKMTAPFSVYASDVALKRITVGFAQKAAYNFTMNGSTSWTDWSAQASAQAFQNWRADGQPGSSMPCQMAVPVSGRPYPPIYMQPVISIDGVERSDVSLGTPAVSYANSAYSSSNMLEVCSTSNQLKLEIALEEFGREPSSSDNPNCIGEDKAPGAMNCVNYTNIAAHNMHALQFYLFQSSDELISNRSGDLVKRVAATPNPNATRQLTEATEGEFLHLVGLKYMRYVADAIKRVGELNGGTGRSGLHIGLTSSVMKVQYIFDIPYAIAAGGYLIDVPGGVTRDTGIVDGQTSQDRFLLSGYALSAYESYVWQENARMDAVSTVRGLQFANQDTTVGTLTIAPTDNWDAKRAQLQVNGTNGTDYTIVGLKYPTAVIDSTTNSGSIKSLVTDGFTVTLPKSLIQYADGWKGIVYAAYKFQPGVEVSATYAINKYAGGYAVGAPLNVGSFSSLLNNSYLPPPLILPTYYSNPVYTNPVNVYDTAPIGWMPASNGITSVSTFAGDPVNLVTGNFYHNEVDIKLKGRGGLPIIFARAYNSRSPQDGALGYGWTHTYEARLKFYGVEADAANGNAQTSKVSWIDGTGAEKYFSTTALTSGQINNNAVLANPTGVFVTFKRQSDGSFSIREKDGLTYVFSLDAGVVPPTTAPGTNTAPVYAKLRSITDRNGNALTLNYLSGQLLNVTDSLGRQALKFTWAGGRISEIRDFNDRLYRYEYTDGNNNLTWFKNPLAVTGAQRGVQYTYYTAADGNGLAHLMKQYTLPRGNGMRFEYYANGRVFRHTAVRTDGSLSADQVNTFTYNDFRRETLHTDERGGEHRYFFDPFGNTLKVTGPTGAENSYVYDCEDPTKPPGTVGTPANGSTPAVKGCKNPHNRLSETNPAGYQTQYRITAAGDLDKVTAASGAATESFDFTTFGQPRRIKDAKGRWTILRYDTRGNVVDSIRMGDGYDGSTLSCASAECAYPASATLIRAWTVNAYDTVGNLTSTKRVRDFAAQLAVAGTANAALANTGPVSTFAYDTNKLNATTASRIGIKNDETAATTVNTATLGYDAWNRSTGGVDGGWYAVTTHYDSLDRIDQATDAHGKLRDYRFDENGNAVGQSLKVTLAGVPTLVDASSSQVDDSDRVIATTDAGGFITAYSYDAAGNVVSVTNPDNYVVKKDYDAAGQPVRVYDQQGNSVVTERDTSGRTRSVTDPNGNVTLYTYWDASKDGRLKTATFPRITSNGSGPVLTSGRSITYDYDAQTGSVTSVTETPAAGSGQAVRVTRTSYDDMNRPVRIVGPQFTDPNKGSVCPVTTQEYDSLGRVIKVRAGHTPSPCSTSTSDVLAVIQSYAYDDFGRKVRSEDGLTRAWKFKYDEHDNLQEATDPRQQKTTYTWDRGGKLLTRVQHGGRTTRYVYNDLGQTVSVFHPEVSYAYGYDRAHRMISALDSRGNKGLAYEWSAGGLLDNVRDADGRQTTYLYDKAGRLINVAAPNGDNVAFQYDAGGRLVQRWMPNGITAQYAYNEDNSLRQVVNRNRANAIVSQHDYAYDGVGSRLRQAESIGGTTINYVYGYDELKRLTQVDNGTPGTLEKYTYDLRNNRLTRSIGQSSPVVVAYVYDDANQLKETRVGSPTGPVLATLQHDENGNIKFDGERTYVWDDLNQLAQVSTASTSVAYGYDGQGRRIRKVVGGQTTQWLYDGQDIAAEYGNTWGQPRAIYVGSGATDDPLVRVTVTGATSYGAASYYHADGLGSVVALSNSADTSNQTQRFDAWGSRTQGTVPQSAQYGFTAREPDETGLVFMRARYYAPNLGRFVGRDPAGLRGGLNSYAYCGNDPVNCVDPSGMLPSMVWNGVSSYFTGTGSFAPTSPDNKTPGSAFKDTGRMLWNVGLDLVEWGFNSMLSAAGQGYLTPEYQPIMSDYRAKYDTPNFGLTLEFLVGGFGVSKLGAGVGKLGTVAELGTGAQSAEAAAALARATGRTSGAAAELRVGNQTFTALSGIEGRVVHQEVQDVLDSIALNKRAPWHGFCAEVGCLTQALDAGVNPAGGVSRAISVGTSAPKSACKSCKPLLLHFLVSEE